jgi:hypothetical protein
MSGWKEKSAALEKLFRDLPICKPEDEKIPYESLIPGIPDQLLLMAPRRSPPRSKGVGAKRGHRMLAQSARRTITALNQLSPSAIAAMLRPAALRQLKMSLLVLAVQAEREGKRGRPKRAGPSQATKIARAVAQHYRGATNKTPTAHDQKFLDLLKAVYVVLGVKASARSQAMHLPPEKLGKNS